MKIGQNQIDELWRIKIVLYSSMTNKRLKETFLIPLFLLFIAVLISDFDKQVLLQCVLSYSAFLSMIMIISNRNTFIKKKRLPLSLPLNALLFYIYDCGFLAMLFISFWTWGYLILQQLSLPPLSPKLLLFLLIFMTFLTIVLSPRILNARSLDKLYQGFKDLPVALVISGSIPGLGILLYAILSRSGNTISPSVVIMFFSFSASLLILPYITIGLFEVLLLGLKQWPEVKKVGSKYIMNGQEIL